VKVWAVRGKTDPACIITTSVLELTLKLSITNISVMVAIEVPTKSTNMIAPISYSILYYLRFGPKADLMLNAKLFLYTKI